MCVQVAQLVDVFSLAPASAEKAAAAVGYSNAEEAAGFYFDHLQGIEEAEAALAAAGISDDDTSSGLDTAPVVGNFNAGREDRDADGDLEAAILLSLQSMQGDGGATDIGGSGALTGVADDNAVSVPLAPGGDPLLRLPTTAAAAVAAPPLPVIDATVSDNHGNGDTRGGGFAGADDGYQDTAPSSHGHNVVPPVAGVAAGPGGVVTDESLTTVTDTELCALAQLREVRLHRTNQAMTHSPSGPSTIQCLCLKLHKVENACARG